MDKNELRKKFNISDDEKISTDKFESIMVAREKKEISKDDFINLLIDVPNFVEVQKEYLDIAKTAFDNAKETQIEALKNISNVDLNESVQLIGKLLSEGNLEKEERLAIINLWDKIITIQDKANDTRKNMNDSNNDFWQKALIGVGSVVGSVAVGLVSYIAYKNKNT
jgi:hypothetical protein